MVSKISLALILFLFAGVGCVKAKIYDPTFLDRRLTEPDVALGKFLKETCYKQEVMALYSFKDKKITRLEEVSATQVSVSVRTADIVNFISENPDFLSSHCHVMNKEIFINNVLDESSPFFFQTLELIESISPYVFNRRIYAELPSPEADIPALLQTEYLAAILGENIGVGYRIVVLSGPVPRVISYGLKADQRNSYREQARTAYAAVLKLKVDLNSDSTDNIRDKLRELEEVNALDAEFIKFKDDYDRIFDAYASSHCSLLQNGFCIEPDYRELFRTINENSVFYITDLGYIR